MRYKYLLLLIVPVALFSCKKETSGISSPGSPGSPAPTDPPITPVPSVLLKDIVIPHLPSPYYHFEYTPEGRTSFASFASDFTRYDFLYDGGRLTEMRNNIIVNKDRLQYVYDNAGRVIMIKYADSLGVAYARIILNYTGQQLITLAREKKSGTQFIPDKTMSFFYHADSNLRQITEHYLPVNGQPDQTFIDRYEQYDNKINVDAFGRLHDEFFDHLVFLPDVRLQKNNPGRITHTGDGVNYQIDYTYIYNDKNAPLVKNGDLLWLTGADAGQHFQETAAYSYY